MSWEGTLDPPQARRLAEPDRAVLREAVERLQPELVGLSDEISRSILRHQPELVAADDPVAVGAVHRATVANVGAILSTLAFGVPPGGLDVPDGALDLLDHVAREPEALPVMLRAYRLGAAGFEQLWAAHLARTVGDAGARDRLTRHSLDHVAVYVDRISEVIVARWESVTAAAARTGRRREAALRALVAGETVDAELLDHPVGLPQLVVAFRPVGGDAAETVLRRLHAAVTAPAIELELADGTTLAWLATDTAATALPSALDAVGAGLGRGWAVATATGPGAGELAGAAADLREALAALRRIRPEGGTTTHADLALIAALLADDARARRLVAAVLGPLAEPTPRNLDLCDTLQAYFAAGERKTGAAALLGVHEKTIAHRLRRAEELLGTTVAARRAALESALLVHRAVVRPGASAAPDSP